jgi:hypothetical protein
MKVKQCGYLKQEFRVPNNLSLERKVIWLQNKYREVLANNSLSKAKKEIFKRYAESLEEVVDYILGMIDYRKLTNEARRVIMFLLSTRKAWTLTPEFCEKKPEEILKFINADFLPDIRKQIILDFLEKPLRKSFQDWEIEILLDEELNNTQVMYMIGRTYESVRSFRKYRNFKESFARRGFKRN